MMPSNLQPLDESIVPSTRDIPPLPEISALRRALVVDDEPLIRWSVAETLRDRGYAVTEAGTAHDALRAVSDDDVPFDVVVLDLLLPDSSDLMLLSRIRALHPDVPIILMTAFGTPEIVEGALHLGAYRVVNKPFEMDDLAELVAQAQDRIDP
jgi:two-component system, NtrC family, response regulator AtoC